MLKEPRARIVFLSILIAAVLAGCGKSGEQRESVRENFDKSYDGYEYYLTKEELMERIGQGSIFHIDTSLKKPIAPFVSEGNWPFYVHEENTVSVAVEFSNLHLKPKETIFPMEERVLVEVVSPDGESMYHFEKAGDEITEDTSVQQQIPVTPGEWTLRVSFAYVCGDSPARFKIAAAYEEPSEEDISWLKEERLNHKENL